MRNSKVKTAKDLEKNPHEAVENLVELITRLGAALANETIYLRQMKLQALGPLQKEKEELVELLEKAKKQVAANIGFANGFTEQEKQELATVGRIFSEIAAENYRELRRAREINRRVIGCISAAAVDYFNRQRGYNYKGKSDGTKKQALPPLSVNSVI